MPRPTLSLLSRDEKEILHEKALILLENVGVAIDDQRTLNILKSAGLSYEKGRVKFPRDVVEWALKRTPKEVTLYSRDGKPYATLSEDTVLFNPGSAANGILDYKSTDPREPVLEDLFKFSLVVEHLENIHLQSTALIPHDVPVELRDRIRLYPILKVSRKPIITGAFTIDGVIDMLKMLEVVIGDPGRKPLAVFDVCPSPPLKWSRITISNLVDCARRRIPIEIIPMPQLGATAPATIGGALIQHHAEALSGITIAQLVNPGSPIIYGGSPCILDMRYGSLLITTPETLLVATAYVELAKHLSLPTHTYMCLSDTRLIDFQAGVESSIGALVATLRKINVVSGPGMIETESVQSLEKLVLDNDVCGYALRYSRGFNLDLESMDVIEHVVSKGKTFLSHRHTLKTFRFEHYFPKVFNRYLKSTWYARGRPSILEIAHERVMELLKKAEPIYLDSDVERSLSELVKNIGRKYGYEVEL